MSERGEYRSIHSVIVDTPDFIDLGPIGQLVWFHLKLRLGATGIGVFNAAEAVLEEAIGCHSDGIGDAIPNAIPNAIAKLIQGGWLVRERNVFWLRNALRFEPSRSMSNANHVKGVASHLTSLPKLTIVNDFADYYHLERPFPGLPESNGITNAIDNGIPNGIPKHGNGERNTETDTETEIPPPTRASEAVRHGFDEIWAELGKGPLLPAESAYYQAITDELVTHDALVVARRAYVLRQGDPKFTKDLGRWIRERGFDDPSLSRPTFNDDPLAITPEEQAQLDREAS